MTTITTSTIISPKKCAPPKLLVAEKLPLSNLEESNSSSSDSCHSKNEAKELLIIRRANNDLNAEIYALKISFKLD